MKQLFTIVFFFIVVASNAQFEKYVKPNGTYGWILNRLYTPYALTPALDTLSDAPDGSIAFKNHVMFFKDTAWKMWAGGIGSDGNNYPMSISFTNNLLTLTRNGLGSITASWDSTLYHSYGFYNTKYAPIVHSHLSTDISDFTTAGRNLLSGGTGISYNPSTGVISWTGAGSGITSMNGLTGTNQTFATGTSGTDFTITSVGTAHTFNFPTASASNRGLLTSSDWTAFNNKQAALVSGTNIKTINGNSLLGSGDLTISGGAGVTDGNKGDITASSSGATWTINNSAVTLAKTTGIEGSFTETVQEFTGSTSMSITLSNTPKSGKAEMYYLNGIVIKSSNVSRTGTTVTLSGFTRDGSDVITAKYSY